MALEAIKPEAILAACVAVGGVVWKIISMVFGLHRRVEAAEKELAQLQKQSSEQYRAVRAEIHDFSHEAKERHNDLAKKLDRLIERQIK